MTARPVAVRPSTVRLSVNLSEETAETLRTIAEKRGMTASEAVRRAIGWLKFIDQEVIENDRRIQLVSKENDKVTDVAVVGA